MNSECLVYLQHVLACAGTPTDCETCAEAQAIVVAATSESPSPEKLQELRAKFIRPAHECTQQFREARILAGTSESLVWCFKCREHLVVNNICLGCGRDRRAKYGDFEREMTHEEWETVRVNLPR